MASRRGSKGEGHVFSLSLSKNSAGGGGGRRRSRENSLGSSHGQGSAASLDDAVPDYQLFEGSVWPTTPLEESLPVLPLSSADDIAVTDVVDDEDQLAALKLTLTGAKLSQQSLLSNPGRPSTTDGIVRRYSVAPEEMMLPTSRRASFSHDPSSGLGASLRPSMTDLGPSVSSPTQGPGLLQMRRASLSPLSPSISRLPSIIRESSSSAPAITAIAQKTAIQEEDGQRDKQRQIRRESADHEKPSMSMSFFLQRAPMRPTLIPLHILKIAVPPSAHASLNNFMSMMSIGTVEAYPALLSEVAQQFKAHIRLTTHTKDSIDYQDSFTGHDAIVGLFLLLLSMKDFRILIQLCLTVFPLCDTQEPGPKPCDPSWPCPLGPRISL